MAESLSDDFLAQNPDNPCPPEILAAQAIVAVAYNGFDGETREGQIVIDRALEQDVRSFFEKAALIGFPIEHVIPASSFEWDDSELMSQNVSSGFNYRTIAGTDKVSLHGLGRAFDINPRLNPYIRFTTAGEIVAPAGAVYDPEVEGTLYVGHPLVEHMKSLGWEWGGDWSPDSGRVDYQHFEKA